MLQLTQASHLFLSFLMGGVSGGLNLTLLSSFLKYHSFVIERMLTLLIKKTERYNHGTQCRIVPPSGRGAGGVDLLSFSSFK